MVPSYHRVNGSYLGLLHCCDDAFADDVHATIPKDDQLVTVRHHIVVADRERFLRAELLNIGWNFPNRNLLAITPFEGNGFYAFTPACYDAIISGV